jgi:hypothetical protein
VIRMRDYRSTPAALSSTLGEIGDASTLDASIGQLATGLLTVHDARLIKHGNTLSATATITQAELRASFPILDAVRPVDSSDGQLTLQGTATVLGVKATIDVTLRPQNGALVASPDVPFGGLATITVFSNPAIAVEAVAATPGPGGFALTAVGRLR